MNSFNSEKVFRKAKASVAFVNSCNGWENNRTKYRINSCPPQHKCFKIYSWGQTSRSEVVQCLPDPQADPFMSNPTTLLGCSCTCSLQQAPAGRMELEEAPGVPWLPSWKQDLTQDEDTLGTAVQHDVTNLHCVFITWNSWHWFHYTGPRKGKVFQTQSSFAAC